MFITEIKRMEMKNSTVIPSATQKLFSLAHPSTTHPEIVTETDIFDTVDFSRKQSKTDGIFVV